MSETRRIDAEPDASEPSTEAQTAVHGWASGSARTPAPWVERAPTPLGAAVGRYVVLEEVGRGGMGRVLRAYDPRLEREVALKEVYGASFGHEHTQRLVIEARAMAKLSHPNVVAVYDVEPLDATSLVLVMEYVPGQTLAQWLATGSRGWREIVQCFVRAGRGLAAAHAAELLHRDFKPANVLVREDGAVKVTDFGLAKAIGERSTSSTSGVDEEGSTRTELTQAGVVLGTPRYMPPEQLLGEPLTAAVDQYAFCVALWEALCGAPPFDGDYRTMARHKLEGPPPWPNPRVPAPLAEAIRRGLCPNAEQRFPSMGALLEALPWERGRRLRRWTTAGVGLLVIAAAGASWRAWSTARAERCSGARAKLEGIWDDARRAEVEAAMQDEEAAYATQAAARTTAALDQYASEWVAMHTEACEATAVRGEQSSEVLDLRMACLRRASTELRATVELLADADADVVKRAHEVIASLRPLSRCTDVEALRADVEPPAPSDAAAVEEARGLVEEARVAFHAGRYPQARSKLEAAKARLAEVDYGPIRTELLLYEGDVLDRLAEPEAAEARLREALESAAAWRQWDAMANVLERLVFVVGYRRQRHDEALGFRELALGLAQHDPQLEAGIRGSLGLVLWAQGKGDPAEAELRRALGLLEQVLGPDDLEVTLVLNNLAAVLVERGKLDEAEALHRRALALREQVLGPAHPSVAQSRTNLGYVLAERGRFEPAEAEYRRAIALFEAALGPEHPEVAETFGNLANLLMEQGRIDEAEQAQRRALASLERARGPDHPTVVMLRSNLGNTLRKRGRAAEAEAEHRRALAAMERSLGPEHPAIATLRSSLASDLQALGELEPAEAELRKVLALRQKLLGPEHPDVAKSHHTLALVLRERGRLEDAEAELRQASVLHGKLGNADHPDVAAVHHDLAEVLLARGRVSEALEHATRAWERRRRGDLPQAARARSAFVLAQVLWATGRDAQTRGKARALAEEAMEGAEAEEDAAEVRAWLAAHGGRG